MTYQVQVTIPYITGLPRDVCTNVLHFDREGLEPVLADLDALVLALRTFYTNVYGAANFAAGYAAWDSVRFKVYNLEDAVPRTPLRDVTHAILIAGGDVPVLPTEVAVVCSVSSSGNSPSQRGRVYLGLLGNAFVEGDPVTGLPVVSGIARATIVSAAEALVGDATDVDWMWVVYSRKLNQTFPVQRGFVDNAFDTQRRRGQDASTRDSWTL